MKILSHLLARLGSRLIWAVVGYVANRSLDTVNTIPLVQITRAGTYVDWRFFKTRPASREKLLDRIEGNESVGYARRTISATRASRKPGPEAPQPPPSSAGGR